MKYKHFNDFDAFASSISDVDSRMMLQNPTSLSWSIAQVILPEIDVQMGQLGTGNIVEGQSWQNGYLLYLPLTDRCAYSGNGTVMDKNSFLILEPGSEFCISTKVAHDWCSIFVPTHKLTCGGDLAEPSSDSGKMQCRVTYRNYQLAQQFKSTVSEIITVARNCPEFESSPAGKCAEAKLQKIASLIVGSSQAVKPKQEGRPKLSRKEIICRCKNLLEENKGKPFLVKDLAAGVKVSERTLRTAFKEYFGVGPLCYFKLIQLHEVHRALKAEDPEAVAVSHVLLQQGVWEFGRFASRYRQVFGELPSETLWRQNKKMTLLP